MYIYIGTKLIYSNIVQQIRYWVQRKVYCPFSPFTKEVNPWLAKRPLKTNERLANLELTSLVKDATANFRCLSQRRT